MATRRVFIGSTAGLSGSYTLPMDFDASASLTVYCIGGGGGGARRSASGGGGGGGGGGAFARGTFSGLKPGQTIYYSSGAAGGGGQSAGANGSAGGDSWVNVSSNAAPTTTAQGVLAKGGTGGFGGNSGAGGSSASSIGGAATAAGGAGGTGGASNGSGGGGGGSAGGDVGGGATITGTMGGAGRNVAGDGGGGGGGGIYGAGTAATSGLAGGAGGSNISFATAAGGASTQQHGTSGTNHGGGGGGAGSSVNSTFGGNGGAGSGHLSGQLNTQTGVWAYYFHGAGGGGGGGSNNSGTTGGYGGNGGEYGGGGGGGGSGVTAGGNGGAGGHGGIILEFTIKQSSLATSTLTFSAIQTYFGGSNPISLSEYYRSTGVVPAEARNNSDVQIPASGQIGVSNFLGAPYKLYKKLNIGYVAVPISKYATDYYYGYNSGGTGYACGTFDSTSFTLSGGSAISDLYWSSYYQELWFTTNSTSNSGWNSIVLPGGVFTRASAGYVSTGNWLWGSVTSNPFVSFSGSLIAGQEVQVYWA